MCTSSYRGNGGCTSQSGVPKPWLVPQNEYAVLRSGFISACSSAARANLKRNFPFGDCLPRSSGSWESSFHSSPPSKQRRLHSRTRLSESTQSTNCSARSSPSNMFHTSSMARHYPAMTSNHCCSSERTELAPTTTMPSYNDLKTAPAMKLTASSSGSSVTEPLLPSSIDTTGMAHSMTSTDAMWAMKTPSFGACTDDTPSISSSFDFTDLPKQEQSVPHGLPLYNHHSASQAIDSPFYLDGNDAKFVHTSISENTGEMSWSEWPVTDSWSHTIPADEHLWQTSYWSGQGTLLHTAAADDTVLSHPHPLQAISSSSIDHHPQAKTTFTPTASSPDLQHAALIHKTSEPTNPHPNLHLQPHPNYQPYTPTSQPISNPSPTPITHPSQPQNPQHHPEPTQIPNPIPSTPEETIRANLHYTDKRNAFLIECKRRGLSYKDIKRIGGFKEAESTLRGRFRTLTKAKEHRVRKPKWHERDVSPLPSPFFFFLQGCAANMFVSVLDPTPLRRRPGLFTTDIPPLPRWTDPATAEGVVEESGAVYLGSWGFVSIWECDV